MDKFEIWKDIPGYEGLYQLSTLDRVKRVSRYDDRNKFLPEMILKPKLNRKCIMYGLTKDKKINYLNLKYIRNLTFPTEKSFNSEWKPVIGFEEYYEVSNGGGVRSKEYEEIVNGKHVHRYPKDLKQFINTDGYYVVKLRDNKHHAVHRLVAEAFVDNMDNLPEVDHIDANRKNNNYTNLRFVTHRDNIRHTIELGNRLLGNTREKNYNSKAIRITDVEDNTARLFGCIMDACEYIKKQKQIRTSINSMYSGLRKAFLNDKPYFGYKIEYLSKLTYCEAC